MTDTIGTKGSKSIRGAASLQFASKYSSILIQLLITAVLARLITPGDFGVLAIVVVFSNFFMLFSDMGIGVAVIQFRDLEERGLGALFVFSLFLAVILALLFCAASFAIAWFYHDSRIVPLCCLASLALLFTTFNMVPNGLMLRDRQFLSIGLRLVASTLVSGCVAIVLAYCGFGAYALVIQIVCSAAFVFLWNIIKRPIRCLNVHFIKPLREVFSYSAFQLAFMFLNYFSRNLDNLAIGKLFGDASLGFYDKAYKLTTYPLNSLSSVVASVVQPFMAEHQDDLDRIFHCWKKIAKGLSLVGVPISLVLICAPYEITEIMYGPQWGESAPLLAVLAVSVYIQLVFNPSAAFFQSIGRTDLMFRAGLINAFLTVLGLGIGILSGDLLMAAACISAAYCLHCIPLSYYLLRRGFCVPVKSLGIFLPEISIGVIAGITCMVLTPVYPANLFLSLIAKLLVLAVIVLLGYAVTGQFRYMKGLLR